MRWFFTAVCILVRLNGSPQIDQKKLDSLSKVIDSSSKAIQSWQDSFDKVQDSLYQSSVQLNVEQNKGNLVNFLAEQKKEGNKNKAARPSCVWLSAE